MENRDDPTAGRAPPSGARSDEEFERMRQAAREQLERARQAGKERIETGKEDVADRADEVASAIDSAGYELHRQGQQTLAAYAGDFAQRLSAFADRLRTGNVDELASEAQELARRNPGLFVVGSIGLGVVLGRFLKASSRRGRDGALDDGARATDEYRGDHEEKEDEYGAGYSASAPPEPAGYAAGSTPMDPEVADPRDVAPSNGTSPPPEPGPAAPGSERERNAGYADQPTGGL